MDDETDAETEEIQEILGRPMGDQAQRVAWTWLQRYRRDALDAAAAGQTRQQREANVRQVRQRLLDLLRAELPGLIERERESEESIREATARALHVYDERFEREVAATLEDPAFERPVAEQIADAELYTYRRELAEEVADLVRYHRGRLQDLVDRLLLEWQ